MTVRIDHVEKINGTRFMGYVIKAHGDMIRANEAAAEYLNINWDDQGFFAVEEKTGAIVGMITFGNEVPNYQQGLWIKLGFVTAGHRGRGVYRALWDRLVVFAQNKGVLTIDGTTHSSNVKMRAVAAKLGRIEHAIQLEFKVPQKQSIG